MDIKKTENKKEYFKKYYQENIEKYRAKNKERKSCYVDCEICNCKFIKKHLSEHKRTKKHINNILMNDNHKTEN